eukprot:m.161633 g.161633  ORF g.161633 m.161633 type:complete len:144 (+) comp10289_c0_seq1:3836-4267(+)
MTSYVSRLEHDERSDVTSPFATWALLKHVDILLRLQRHSEAVELTCRLDNIKTLSFPLQYLSKCVLFTLKVLQECMNKADIDTCWELAGRTVRVLETFFNDVEHRQLVKYSNTLRQFLRGNTAPQRFARVAQTFQALNKLLKN